LDNESKYDLFETAFNLVGLTHGNNMGLCFVVEFMNPQIRSVTSELFCALSSENLEMIKTAFSSAYYKSLLNMKDEEVPLPVIG